MGFKEWYKSKPILNAIGNSAAIYTGVRALGYVTGRVFDAEGLEDAINLSSPFLAGLYLNERIKGIKDNFLRNISKVGVGVVIGSLAGNAIYNFNGGLDWSNSLKEGYLKFVDLMSNLTGSDSGGVNGSVVGLAGGLLSVLNENKKHE